MKKGILFTIVALFLFARADLSQTTGKTPYPVLFLHGLVSSDGNWSTSLVYLSDFWGLYSADSNVFHVVTNAYGGMTNIAGPDGTLGTIDDDVLVSFNNEDNILPDRSMFAMNFQNFWNESTSDPQIVKYVNDTPGSNESPSNQTAIVKQGYALKKMIEAVIAATGADKVILIGHSMGGLEAREYLQRTDGTTPRWWVDPASPDGHKVAKLVTLGTPHLGSNLASGVGQSEAIRDLRYGFDIFPNPTLWAPDPSKDDFPYLFGGSETMSDLSTFYNADVNCDGDALDTDIVGINSGSTNGEYNPNMPLPTDIEYTWVVSDNGGTGDPDDGVVRVDRQYLYNIGDTVMTNSNHEVETSDEIAIIRGLDEPDTPEFAYGIDLNTIYSCFVTMQPDHNPHDIDMFKVVSGSSTGLGVVINTSDVANCGIDSVRIVDVAGAIVDQKQITTVPDTISGPVTSGAEYYIEIIGDNNSMSYSNPYTFEVIETQVVGVNDKPLVPAEYRLEQNYPNPFNPATTIRFNLKNAGHVKLSVYNVLGSEVRELVNGFMDAGQHKIKFNAAELSSGIYYYKLTAGSKFHSVKKMILMK